MAYFYLRVGLRDTCEKKGRRSVSADEITVVLKSTKLIKRTTARDHVCGIIETYILVWREISYCELFVEKRR